MPRRSGAPPRFLVYRSPEYWAIKREFVFYNLLFGFLPLFAALYFSATLGWEGVDDLLDPRDPLHRLTGPAGAGAAPIRARIAAGEICLVIHQRPGKKNGWTEDWRGTYAAPDLSIVPRLAGAPGEGAPTSLAALGIAPAGVRWEPRIVVREPERWQSRYASLPMPGGGRVLAGCLGPGDRFFLDVPPRSRSRAAVVLTPGDGTPRLRIAELAAARAGQVSLLGLAVLLVLAVLRRLLAAHPIADALVKRLHQPLVPFASPLALVLLGATPLGLLAALWGASHLLAVDGPADVTRWPWAGALFAVVAGVIAALRMGDRRAELAAAMDLVERAPAPSTPLSRARDQEAFSLDAAVDPAAPLSPAPLTGAPRAHWAVQITRLYKAGKNFSAAPPYDHSGPLVVPISTDLGSARIDLTHAAVDLRASRRVVHPRALRRGLHREIVGDAWPDGSSCLLEERFLDPGEGLHLIGRVVRFEATAGGGRVPVLGGSAGEPLIVHAGSRRSLLRGLALERGFLSGAIPVCVGVSLAMVGVAVYLGRL